ncbi:hypothetical protein [Streptomyces bauhiniae]|uniref:hypothetical protein n=1 Tax=Streptomyces bauhiniae TaxID=2340725 RepID=UPI0035DF3C59
MEQAAQDLEENRRQQAAMAAQLASLREEELLLENILNLAEHSAALPRQQSPASPAEPSDALASDNVSPSPPGAVRSEPVRARRHAGLPLLRELLVVLLAGHREPRLAKELHEELLEKHSDRRPSPQVVRNTLEDLVAKGQVRRHKQARTVTYTLSEADQVLGSP